MPFPKLKNKPPCLQILYTNPNKIKYLYKGSGWREVDGMTCGPLPKDKHEARGPFWKPRLPNLITFYDPAHNIKVPVDPKQKEDRLALEDRFFGIWV
jgi:hypothetical protein